MIKLLERYKGYSIEQKAKEVIITLAFDDIDHAKEWIDANIEEDLLEDPAAVIIEGEYIIADLKQLKA